MRYIGTQRLANASPSASRTYSITPDMMGEWRRKRYATAIARKAQAAAEAAARLSPLLLLPGELRTQIHEYYLNDLSKIHIDADGHILSPLAQVERRIRDELKSMFCPEYFLSVKRVSCNVHNFEFSLLAAIHSSCYQEANTLGGT